MGPSDSDIGAGFNRGAGGVRALGVGDGAGVAEGLGEVVGVDVGRGEDVGVGVGTAAWFSEEDPAGAASMMIVRALESGDVIPFKPCIAVTDQVPSPRVGNVQEELPEEEAGAVVQERLVDPALLAVTVAVAPSVIPARSMVGVLS
jgi:hypothetical protein